MVFYIKTIYKILKLPNLGTQFLNTGLDPVCVYDTYGKKFRIQLKIFTTSFLFHSPLLLSIP